MHAYAAEGRSRHVVYLTIALLATVSAWGLHQVVDTARLEIPWWIETPSVLGFFGLYWKWFDLQLWRLPLVQKRGWLGVPDLRGKWSASLRTSYENGPSKLRGEVRIEQTYSRISIVSSWPDSHSHSVSAVLQTGAGASLELLYTYVSEPRTGALATMQMHRGTTWLCMAQARPLLEGHYYSGRGRQGYGDLRLQRIEDGANADAEAGLAPKTAPHDT